MPTALSKSSDSFPFLRLPRELRDKIYDACLQNSCFRIDHIDCFALLSYDDVKSDRRRWLWPQAQNEWPQWLLTNKQLLREGFEQFYREATGIEFEHTEQFVRRSQNFGQAKLKKRMPRKAEEVTQSPREYSCTDFFPNLHQLRSFDLVDIRLSGYEKYDSELFIVYIASQDILHLRHWVALHQGSLKALKLTFLKPMSIPYMPQESKLSINMSELENIAMVDQVEIAIYDPGLRGIENDPTTVARVMAQTKVELKRIVHALVENGNGDTIIREWIEIKNGLWDKTDEWHFEVKRCVKKS